MEIHGLAVRRPLLDHPFQGWQQGLDIEHIVVAQQRAEAGPGIVELVETALQAIADARTQHEVGHAVETLAQLHVVGTRQPLRLQPALGQLPIDQGREGLTNLGALVVDRQIGHRLAGTPAITLGQAPMAARMRSACFSASRPRCTQTGSLVPTRTSRAVDQSRPRAAPRTFRFQ